MNSTHVFKNLNQDSIRIFDLAGNPAKVACVALDYAKQIHKALICDGQGRSLKAPFDVHNTPQGVSFLCDQIQKTCRR